MLYTSGTSSGVPKGVLLSHSAIYENVLAIIDYMKPHTDDIFYIAKTLVHVSAITGELLVAMISGASVWALSPICTPTNLVKRLYQSNATIIHISPAMLRLLGNVPRKKICNFKLSNVHTVYSNGAFLPRSTIERSIDIFYNAIILSGYGLTEASPRLTCQKKENKCYKYECAGYPIKGVKIKIIDEVGNVLKPNQKGIIYASSPSLMIGYYKNPHETENRIKDGWLNTRDMGYLDEDGELFVLGRADDIIVHNSNNVDPQRVENAVLKIPDILECMVFGCPNNQGDNDVICAIVTKDGTTVDRKKIISYINTELLPVEYPCKILIWNSLPRTKTGKYSRKLGREQYINSLHNKQMVEQEYP